VNRLAGLRTETGVVPRAPHQRAVEDAVGERAAVVGALAAHPDDAAVEAQEERRLAVDDAARHATLGDVREGHALRAEIRSGRDSRVRQANRLPLRCGLGSVEEDLQDPSTPGI
jgi:hypothetical protein